METNLLLIVNIDQPFDNYLELESLEESEAKIKVLSSWYSLLAVCLQGDTRIHAQLK